VRTVRGAIAVARGVLVDPDAEALPRGRQATHQFRRLHRGAVRAVRGGERAVDLDPRGEFVPARMRTSSSVSPHVRSSSTPSRSRFNCAGLRATNSTPSLAMSASIPSVRATAITSSTVCRIAPIRPTTAARPLALA
jgi:hypothetical protein